MVNSLTPSKDCTPFYRFSKIKCKKLIMKSVQNSQTNGIEKSKTK